MASDLPLPDTYQHRRPKTSVLGNLSFMHKRTTSEGLTLPSNNLPSDFVAHPNFEAASCLPMDHPQYRALGELLPNQQNHPPSPTKSIREGSEGSSKSLHKKTLSTLSLKSLSKKDGEKATKVKEPKVEKPKKTKTSTNLANLLSRPKSSKSLRKDAAEQELQAERDKENVTPTATSPLELTRPPIYAQFSSEYFTKQPLGGKFLEDEIDLYTPQDYSPGKQRNFYDDPGSQPTLGRRDEPSSRPKSTYLPSSFSVQDISRRVSGEARRSAELIRRTSARKGSSSQKVITPTAIAEKALARPEKAIGTRSQRVLAAVSSTFAKTPKPAIGEGVRVLEDKDVEAELEAMLARRNIPEHQRRKMHSLALSVKKDLIKQDWEETANGRPGTDSSASSADAAVDTNEISESKAKRPRSRTFTLSRGSSKEATSPTKKSKSEATFSKHSRKKSTESINRGTKTLTTAGAGVAQSLIAKAKGQSPDDFVSYVRKVQKPELVEVGRLHKLRLLLRNETVAWTDDFIRQGGLEEIVGLLHRIMEVEWREEHEDALLHEVLLCLKALSTTALALQHLNEKQKTLFPALLHMIFDEEKKGPSEFTTRNIVSSLLFTYLKAAPLSERTHCAKTLLSYLRDPEPTESQRPVEFVLDMRRPRPFRVWNKEVVNVTKEVFWIFLHNLNVIALPGTRGAEDFEIQDNDTSIISPATSRGSFDICNPFHLYMSKYFPRERPPVPAAPYVGGVEWDATNYLASHLDLVNGIMACLPTQDERNILREQMLVSGWEKCMGGTLRLCKEKFYGSVHAGLRCWVAAAVEDGWDTRDVRCGPAVEKKSPVKRVSPKKASQVLDDAPRIEMKLDFLGDAGVEGSAVVGGDEAKHTDVHDAWL